MENVWTTLITAVVVSMLAPALMLWMQNSAKRRERLDSEAREDAREARAQAQRQLMIASLELVKKQTDGVLDQVAAVAKAMGRVEGGAEAEKKAEGTAATLALGQQQGRDAERESIATKATLDTGKPLPVQDARVAETSERTAEATEVLADATKRLADKADKK